MQIGAFGNLAFETSDSRILTYREFKHDSGARWAKHEVIGGRSKSEFLGSDDGKITFIIQLNAGMHVNPRAEVDKWYSVQENGTVNYLVVGGRPIGRRPWKITKLSESDKIVYNDGSLYSCELAVTLEGYN